MKEALLAVVCLLLASVRAQGFRYGVVIDAGSSGSRAHLFKWSGVGKNLKILEVDNKKARPGIDDNKDDVPALRQQFTDLLNTTRHWLPSNVSPQDVELIFMATAGVRNLDPAVATKLMKNVRKVLTLPGVNPFKVTASNIRVISGNEEAIFSWITLNYLTGYLKGKTERSAGLIEVGGASMQVALIPDAVIQADKVVVKVMGETHEVFAKSYLQFGAQELLRRMAAAALRDNSTDSSGAILTPCYLRDYETDLKLEGKQYTVRGQGSAADCSEVVARLLRVDQSLCYTRPCAIGAYYQPPLPQGLAYYSVQAAGHTMRRLGALGEDGAFSLAALRRAVNVFCAKSYNDVQSQAGEDAIYFGNDCGVGSFLVALYRRFGFDGASRLISVPEINDMDLSWPLGALLYDQGSRCPEAVPPTSGAPSLSATTVVLSLIVLSRLLY